MKFEVVTTTAGSLSIRNNELNEIMHNPIGPWAEAQQLYIEPSRILEHLTQPGSEYVIYDVGLGAATNAIAALTASEHTSRPIKIVSFEKDLELLQFALQNIEQFSFLAPFKNAIESILEKGQWQKDHLSWELRYGDFRQTIESEKTFADLIFFEPYSPKVNSEMWTADVFKNLRSRCQTTNLFTYSQATPIRAGLLSAGFFVGYGPALGFKEQTTQASTHLENLAKPLDERWMKRLMACHVPLPMAKEKILEHTQFNGAGSIFFYQS